MTDQAEGLANDDILFGSATAAVQALRRGDVSSRELTELLLARIAAVDPVVNAVVELRGDEALSEADAADRAIASGAERPLLGVPLTVKDSFNVRGLHTTWGNPEARDYVADSDATVVQRLKQAGAIIVGKSNVHFMLADYGQTANDLYGVTRNPWDTARTPGGSSGGGAAALAAAMTFLEYGSDLVGSIRIPASFCGVYGLKPSAGIVPLAGFQPPGGPPDLGAVSYMSAVGPLGRCASDLRTALAVTAGPAEPEANAYSWRLAPPRHARLEDYRVGVVLDHERVPVSGEVGAQLSAAVDALARAGVKIVEGWPAGVDPVRDYESFGYHVQLFFAFRQPGQDPGPAAAFVAQESRRMAARAAWGRYFEDIDVFVCPTAFTTAFPHDSRPFEQRTIATPEGERRYDDLPFWISHASLPGLPAVSAPVGTTPAGLPVGAQIIGPLYEDDTPVAFAGLLAGLTGGYQRPPA